MARIRTIKPEFFTSEDIVSLTPLARLFYVSLWCESDREGRLSWRPKTLKMRYLPGDNCDIDALAQELSDSGLIAIYEVDGKLYAEIPSFKNHQVINNRESESILPSRVEHASKRVKAEGRKEGKGKEGTEGKGTEGGGGEVDELASGFDDFWSAWPSHHRKGEKDKCLSRWKADKLHKRADEVVGNVRAWKKSAQWAKDGGQYIPAPLVYLRSSTYDNPTPPAASQRQLGGVHTNFDKVNYNEGINEDGTFD